MMMSCTRYTPYYHTRGHEGGHLKQRVHIILSKGGHDTKARGTLGLLQHVRKATGTLAYVCTQHV